MAPNADLAVPEGYSVLQNLVTRSGQASSIIRKLPAKNIFDIPATASARILLRCHPFAIALATVAENIVAIRCLNP